MTNIKCKIYNSWANICVSEAKLKLFLLWSWSKLKVISLQKVRERLLTLTSQPLLSMTLQLKWFNVKHLTVHLVIGWWRILVLCTTIDLTCLHMCIIVYYTCQSEMTSLVEVRLQWLMVLSKAVFTHREHTHASIALEDTAKMFFTSRYCWKYIW